VTADVIGDLIENGAVARGWLGVNIQSLTPELAEGIGRSPPMGRSSSRLPTARLPTRPACAPATRSWPWMTATVEGPTELARIIGSYDPDETVEVLVWRDGREQR
jgi:serine protease Do